MVESDHHSIGEVLAMVQQDFPDVTISKIRFLESQGLLDPERTNSGYRKFYDGDVERLRWILHQQRDHYLPLKVIKDRILNGFADDADDRARRPGSRQREESEGVAEPESPPTLPSSASTPAPGPAVADPLDEGVSTVSMTADELAAASGLSAEEIGDLDQYGLIESRAIGSADLYEGEDLQVARLAAEFIGRGIEVRHLKMYLISAQREAGFYEQVLSPLTGHRNQATRRRARSDLRDLIRLGAEFKSTLLRRSLREHLGGT